MKHLAIYYIATADYKNGFNHFNNSMKFLYPSFKKTIIIISDGLTEWDGVVDGNTTYKTFHIDHFPWPIITLFKMKYIYDHQIDCDYAAYFNADLQYNIHCNPKLLNKINLEKLNVSRHYVTNTVMKYDNHLFENVTKLSCAYIDYPYTYIQGGLIIGKSDIFYMMCNDVSKMVTIDLRKNIIPQWHDESYLNKWVQEHQELVEPPFKLMAKDKFHPRIPFATINTYKKEKDEILQ